MKKLIAICLLCLGMYTKTKAQTPDDHKDDFTKLIEAAKSDFKDVIGEKKKEKVQMI